ncbi:MAG: methionine--tRNA ligase [Nanoarchaeota archaeon]|nr:methionine--tRNA ligase [Nanoarchaeota archaeon]
MVKFYVTTPIYYVNYEPSLGSAYTTIAADILARYHRLKGEDVCFLTGLDENSIKTIEAAKREKKSIKEYTDLMAKKWKEVWRILNISNTDFIRTTETRHKKVVQEIFMKIYNKGDIYKGKYEGLYCDDCENFLMEKDLIDYKCPDHKKEPKKISEENYFFKLSKYQKQILDHINKNPDFIKPNYRKKEIINFINEGLKDLSISRPNLNIGIELPIDKTHKFWTWFDALNNYITASKGYWPANIHLVGKDIQKFHCIYFPAFLFSSEYKISKQVYSHGFLTINGQKMSKSLGNAIDPVYLSKKYSVDSLRYFLMREIPFGQDGDFSEKALVARLNSELADALGNLLNRVMVMCQKYFDSVPTGKEDKNLTSKLNLNQIDKYMENLEFHNALSEIWKFIDECNKYINDKEPWNLEKNNKQEELKNVLYNLAESIRIIAELIYSFMPESSEKIHTQLGYKMKSTFNLKFGNSKSKGLGKPETLFKKIKVE